MDEMATAVTDSIPIACTMDERELALRSEYLRRELFAAIEETRELEDGYAFRFPGTDRWKAKLLEFVDVERRCCSFFRIELVFEPALGPIWLHLRGPEGVKEFIRAPFGESATAPIEDNRGALPVSTIERDELKAKLERGEPLTIVEALPEPYYRKAHLPGAINLPVDLIDERASALLPDKQAEIVVYCANLACQNSAIAAQRLIELGYTSVRDYAAGKQDWIEAGHQAAQTGRPHSVG